MRKLLIGGGIVLILVAAYVVFTLKSGEELQEASPLDQGTFPGAVVKDSLDAMDAQTRASFESEVSAMKDVVMQMAEAMPSGAKLVARGDFKPRIHSVQGQALLINEGGKKTVRFENFETDNGPNLHIYLSADLGGDDYVDLGKIRATKGNVNYEVPPSVDTSRYSRVLVWCVPFGVLFSYAELSPVN